MARKAAFATSASAASASSAPDLDAMKRRPAKFIPDYLTPMPSHLLTTTLSDLLDSAPQQKASRSSPSFSSSPTVSRPARALPQGHHLVYFPIQTAPSALSPDGADPDHGPGEPFDKRLWAGGEVVFHRGWQAKLVQDGRPWACREEFGDVTARGREGQEKVFVDLWRRYGLGHESGDEGGASGLSSRLWQIEERRTLAFMRNEPDASASAAPPRQIKRTDQSIPIPLSWP